MAINLLEVKGLKKYYPTVSGFFRRHIGEIRSVDGVDFSISKGEIVGLVGESGSGKSTLARAAIRLIEPSAGELFFRGNNLLSLDRKHLLKLRPKMQMVFQDPFASLNPRKSIAEAIGEPLRYHKIVYSKEEESNAVASILEKVGLAADVMHRYPHQFSGGQQQRICIGRAIALDPELLICDEAVSALDVSVQAQILNLLFELQQQLNLSYLFISHDLSIVRHICSRVLVLYQGKIVESGHTEQIFSNPAHSYTQMLLAAIPARHPKERRESIIYPL